MGTQDENEENTRKADPVDLNELRGLDIGPNWTERPQSAAGASRGKGKGAERRDARSRGGKKDRRFDAAPGGRRPAGKGGEGRAKSAGRGAPRVFEPTVDVHVVPEEAGFQAICRAMRHSCRTYELFEIARLILARPERCHFIIRSRAPADGGAPPELFYSVPDGLPFETEAEAVRHVLEHHLESFFETETVELDPPKGHFQMVKRCSITGEILGPPNYHRYTHVLNRHHATRLPDFPYEKFLASIETVKDEEAVKAWMESMTRGVRYFFKEKKEDGDPVSFDSATDARAFLLKHCGDRVVKRAKSVRFAGKDLDKLPRGNIRRSIEATLEHQQRFPLVTANGLRVRLRHQKFHIYKKGTHGVSFVCAVRRSFREPDQVFAESVQKLIDFLEANPMIHANQLPEAYLGLSLPSAEKPAEASPPSNEGEEAEQPSREDSGRTHPGDPALKKLLIDLRWLLTEGYVTEYSDGRLYVQPMAAAESAKKREGPGAGEAESSGEHPDGGEPSRDAGQAADDPQGGDAAGAVSSEAAEPSQSNSPENEALRPPRSE